MRVSTCSRAIAVARWMSTAASVSPAGARNRFSVEVSRTTCSICRSCTRHSATDGVALLEAHAERGGGRALDVEIDEQHLVAAAREARGEVDRGGGLADAALLIRDAENGHGATLRPS